MAPHEVEATDTEFSDTSAIRQGRKPIDSILRVRGTEIVDGNGDPVILKGVGFRAPKDYKRNQADLSLGRAWGTYEYGELYHGVSRTRA
jgi:hypothetical protein